MQRVGDFSTEIWMPWGCLSLDILECGNNGSDYHNGDDDSDDDGDVDKSDGNEGHWINRVRASSRRDAQQNRFYHSTPKCQVRGPQIRSNSKFVVLCALPAPNETEFVRAPKITTTSWNEQLQKPLTHHKDEQQQKHDQTIKMSGTGGEGGQGYSRAICWLTL
jgi:hypothetical protein